MCVCGLQFHHERLDMKPAVWNFCPLLLAVRVITQTLSTRSVTPLLVVVYSISAVAPPSALANQFLLVDALLSAVHQQGKVATELSFYTEIQICKDFNLAEVYLNVKFLCYRCKQWKKIKNTWIHGGWNDLNKPDWMPWACYTEVLFFYF